MTTVVPSVQSDIDLFSDEVLRDPYPHLKVLRDLGPAVWLTTHDMWFVGRYDRVRTYLKDWETFVSGRGIGMNDLINEAWTNAVIAVDPPVHTAIRKVFTDRLGPRQLRPISDTIDGRADDLVRRLLADRRFDAVTDLAHDLPVNIIMDLIGWPVDGRDQLLSWAEGSFNAAGPANDRMFSSLPRLQGLFEYLVEVATPENLTPGSFGASIYEAADRGEVPRQAAIPMLAGYATAALDTTINAIATGVHLFATNPDQWTRLRSEPTLIPNAFNEILRYDPPIQFFSRVATRDVDMGDGVVIPADSRVVHSYAAANRDERHYPDPDRFDIGRRANDHLAFDYGTHACAGQGLARLEVHAVLGAMVRHVQTIELDGEPERTLNNITRGFSHLPVRVS